MTCQRLQLSVVLCFCLLVSGCAWPRLDTRPMARTALALDESCLAPDLRDVLTSPLEDPELSLMDVFRSCVGFDDAYWHMCNTRTAVTGVQNGRQYLERFLKRQQFEVCAGPSGSLLYIGPVARVQRARALAAAMTEIADPAFEQRTGHCGIGGSIGKLMIMQHKARDLGHGKIQLTAATTMVGLSDDDEGQITAAHSLWGTYRDYLWAMLCTTEAQVSITSNSIALHQK